VTPPHSLPRTPLLTRRQALLGALCATSIACRSRSEPSAHAQASAQAAASAATNALSPWGGLELKSAGDLGPEDRGGRTVVLLHGFGAEGDDLLPLARSLAAPRTRFLVPAAPIALLGGGRAWWQLEASDHPSLITTTTIPTAPESNAHLHAARVAVQTILHTAVARYAPESLLLAGFSQGAMLALDVALAIDSPPVSRVAVLSGALLTEAAQTLDRPRAARPRVFISHGEQDQRLPFVGAEIMQTLLDQHQFPVTFFRFQGGHAIPRPVIEAAHGFLFDPQ